jgi:hypothetical protein
VASSSRSSATPTRPAGLGDVGDDSKTAFLRTRLKLRCIERASKARERAVNKKRAMMSSSDDMDMDEDEDGDDPEFDEVRATLTFSVSPPLTWPLAVIYPSHEQYCS